MSCRALLSLQPAARSPQPNLYQLNPTTPFCGPCGLFACSLQLNPFGNCYSNYTFHGFIYSLKLPREQKVKKGHPCDNLTRKKQ